MTAAHHRRAALAFAALLALAIALMIVRVWWRFGSDTFFGDWLYNGVILGCAVLAAWRALVLPGDRLPWLLIGLGLASWFAGDVWWVIHATDDIVPIPSLADWLYFGMYPPFLLAIVLLVRERLRGGRHTLVLCDLNGFKRYNDTFGHAAGDALLFRLGVRLAAATAAHGRAYRMGGDEFCVLLDGGLSPSEALALVAPALEEQGEGFSVDASCGVVELPLEAGDAADALRLADARMYERKRRGRLSAAEQGVALLLRLLSERDPELGDHVDGVAELAAAVAERLELPAGERENIRSAAALHDVGKLAIPDSILAKPGPLDDDEWSFMRRHTLIGERILGATPGLACVAALVRASHERPDGRGYPDRLIGDEIPLGARIVAVCDAYHAMVSDRPYRRALAQAVALAELRGGAGTQFDAAVVEAFAAVLAARPVAVA